MEDYERSLYKYPWLDSNADDGVNYEDLEGGYSAVPHREKYEEDGSRRLLQPVLENEPGPEPKHPGAAPPDDDPNLVSAQIISILPTSVS